MVHDPNTKDAWADIKIRTATAAETPDIEHVLSLSLAEYESRYTNAAFKLTAPSREKILRRMDEGPVWVAVHNGEVVGTISAIPKGREIRIRGLAVRPAERGRGIGRLLLVHVARYAFTNGFRRMSLSTTPFLTRANREYEQFGFQRSSEGPQIFHGTPIYTMTKFL
jgi:GNAT superfamily N-acetyltransferase